MKQFPPDIRFKYSWRKYQQRVLEELEVHLDDNHLHIIAPPGSGKTILGLEVALRLNRPTLILPLLEQSEINGYSDFASYFSKKDKFLIGSLKISGIQKSLQSRPIRLFMLLVQVLILMKT